MMQTVGNISIDKVTVIDKELAAGSGGNLAVKTAVTAEQIKQLMGVDIAQIAQNLGGARPSLQPPTPPRPRPPTRDD